MAPPKGFIPHNKKEIDLDLMKELYYKRKFDFKELAAYFGLKSKSSIYDRFKKLGLQARTNIDLKTGNITSAETKEKIAASLCKRTKPYIYRGYRRVRVGNKFVDEHVFVWEIKHGRTPKGYVIHHRNIDKLDNQIENLRLMKIGDHIALHNKLKLTKIKKQDLLNKIGD